MTDFQVAVIYGFLPWYIEVTVGICFQLSRSWEYFLNSSSEKYGVNTLSCRHPKVRNHTPVIIWLMDV